MKLLELPNGNKQKVFIDKDWANGELERSFTIESTEAKEAYKELIAHLTYYGYEVLFDEDKADYDTFFFTPRTSMIPNELDAAIRKVLENTPVKEPKTVSFPEDTFPEVDNLIPFIFKNGSQNGGKEKYIIRDNHQLTIFKDFYNRINEIAYKTTWAKAKELYPFCFDENGNLKMNTCNDGVQRPSLSIYPTNYKRIMHKCCTIQEYIEAPTDYNTSLRVLISADGDILCASLKYSSKDNKKPYSKNGLFDQYLGNPKSEFYLGNENIVSNSVAGGNSILLGKNFSQYTPEERAILSAHNIDPRNAQVPSTVLETAREIMKRCRTDIGAISGMDYIYDVKENKWKYLEDHSFPMLSSYCEAYGLEYCSSDDDNFMQFQRSADIDARLRALSLKMQKEQKPIHQPRQEKIF